MAEHGHFFPLPFFNWVFAARAIIGYASGWGGEEVPIFERFFLGGATTLRGQGTREVGPRDENGAVIGGTSEILFSAELLVPIFPRFRLVFFFDAGNAYGFGDPFDPTDLRLGCTINGEPIQDGRTADMRFSIAEIVDYLSRHVRLEPFDLIATGTPARLTTPPGPDRHLETGDVVTCWIEGIGELTATVA